MYVLVVRAFFAALFIQPSCIMHTESVLKLNFTVQVFPFVRLSGIALFRANSFVLAAAHTHTAHIQRQLSDLRTFFLSATRQQL